MSKKPRALLLDFGGVLTQPMLTDLPLVDRRNGLPEGTTKAALARAYGKGGEDSPIARLERGELALADFEREFAEELGVVSGGDGGIVTAVFGELRLQGRLWSASYLLRAEGILTGLLSNSWGTSDYPMDLIHRTFDDVVISGEVGLRKPDPAIFLLAAERLDVAPDACVFVDDHPLNLKAAAALGMQTILHRGDDTDALSEVATAFDTDLSAAEDVSTLR